MLPFWLSDVAFGILAMSNDSFVFLMMQESICNDKKDGGQ